MGKKDKRKSARESKPNDQQTEKRMEDPNENPAELQENPVDEGNTADANPSEDQTPETLSSEGQDSETKTPDAQTSEGAGSSKKVSLKAKFLSKPEKTSKTEKAGGGKRAWKKPDVRIRLPLGRLKDRRVVTLGVFAAVALAMILLGVLLLKIPVVPACSLIVIETVLAVLLHNTELWTHGMLLLAEIIAGILAGQVIFVVFCVIVYVAATISIQILSIEEKAVRRKS